MATVINGNVGCDDGFYTGDGRYGDKTPADRAVVAYAWPIIKDLLSKYIFLPYQARPRWRGVYSNHFFCENFH